MVNSIPSTSMGLPTDLVNIELPQTMQPSASVVTATESSADVNTSSNQQGGARHPNHPESSLERMLDQINDSMRAWSTGMRFDIDEDVERVVVSIIDNDSGEVLRTVPTEAVLRVAKMIAQLQGGGINTQA